MQIDGERENCLILFLGQLTRHIKKKGKIISLPHPNTQTIQYSLET